MARSSVDHFDYLEIPSMYMDSTLFLKDVSICKQNYLLKTFIYDVAAISRDTAYGIVHQSKKVAKLSLSPYEVR